jgi:hypothetical protein
MDKLLDLYSMSHSNENYNKIASALVAMREDSKRGISEMKILKASIKIYKKNMSMGDLIGLAATLLEYS